MSRGRTGDSVFSGNAVSARDFVDYECTENVSTLIQRYGPLVGSIVCVTWDTEDARNLRKLIAGENIIQITDRARPLSTGRELIGGRNRYRQFESTLAGLEILKSRGCKLALKIRTDQSIDVERLAEFLEALEMSGELGEHIVVASFSKNAPWELGDFYLGAKIDILIRACRSYLGYGGNPFADSVHKDLFFKWAWSLAGPDLGFPLIAYFPFGNPIQDQADVIRLAWRELFRVFPRDIATQLTWRGTPMREVPTDLIFSDQSLGAIESAIAAWNASRPSSSRVRWLRIARGLANTDYERFLVHAYGPGWRKVGQYISSLQRAILGMRDPGRAARYVFRRLGALVTSGHPKPEPGRPTQT